MQRVAITPVNTPLIRRTLLARAIAAHDIHAYSLAFVATFGEDGETGIGDILAARRLSVLTKRYRVMSILVARIVRGSSWAAVARGLGIAEQTAVALFAATEQRWRDGDPAPWNEPVPSGTGRGVVAEVAPPIDIDDADIDRLAAELDTYFARHTDDIRDVRACAQPPVSGGLPV